jgi:hypothetical protein
MISMDKTYEENISRKENRYCAKLVEKLISTGEIDEKYKPLMDTQTIINIVLLALIYMNCMPDGKIPIKGQMAQHITKKGMAALERIGTLFSSLPQNIREQLIFSLGLDFIVINRIDEIEPYESTMKEVSKRFRLTPNAAKPLPLPNTSK